jgi:carbamoyl-phosphate synthase large subunit
MAGEKIADMDLPDDERRLGYYCVKEAVMPFGRFPGTDVVLGPEMRSTGEVMGIAKNFPAAYAKTQLAISYKLPEAGKVFLSVCDRDKRHIVAIARDIIRMGFTLLATAGTARTLEAAGIPVEEVKKVNETDSTIVDEIMSGEVSLMINTPLGNLALDDGYYLRSLAVRHGISHVTTLAGAQALIAGMEAAIEEGGLGVKALQDLPGLRGS